MEDTGREKENSNMGLHFVKRLQGEVLWFFFLMWHWCIMGALRLLLMQFSWHSRRVSTALVCGRGVVGWTAHNLNQWETLPQKSRWATYEEWYLRLALASLWMNDSTHVYTHKNMHGYAHTHINMGKKQIVFKKENYKLSFLQN